VTLGVAAYLSYLLRDWSMSQISRLFVIAVMAFLGLLTARSAFRASYINGDDATEYLVYAHSGPGVKIALSQIEEISRRTTGSLDMVVAYDNLTTYPYWWYLRNFTNQRYYGTQPTREQLRDAPVILVGDRNAAKVEPIVGQAYDQFDYIRIWWPNQDYYDLTPERVANAILDPAMRAAIFKIWLNRDYRDYAALTQNNNLTLSTWTPSESFRLYVRKDITAKIWQYGSTTLAGSIVADPYEGKGVTLSADMSLSGADQGITFNRPRSVAAAPDGSLYVADSGNHRIVHFSADMQVLQSWGQFGDVGQNTGQPGTFNEPWSVSVGPDGFVYVADTWNHRIQKFSPEGQFVTTWGTFGQAERPDAFWGPRSVVVDSENRVYVTDTGNKRIVIFDSTGNYISQFGSAGAITGQFDEPVGIALDDDGNIYAADTWNQRIQVFEPTAGGNFNPLREWEVVGWYGESLDNKPYLAVDASGNVYVSDPEGNRILQFQSDGMFVRYWGDAGDSATSLNIPIGLAVDGTGGLWVADSANNRIQHFRLSEP
jgi:sugar lactone lactonase YvrE